MQTKHSFFVFLQFLRRDMYVHAKKTSTYLVNYVLIYPIVNSISFAYLQTNAYFGTGNVKTGTMIFAGNILLSLLVISYFFAWDLLFDLEYNRFIDYQITRLRPQLIILERIIFSTFMTFMFTLPFFPIAKLILGNHLDTSNSSWGNLVLVLGAGSFCCAAYHQCITLLLRGLNQAGSLWARCNHTLLLLGGFWIPWHIMNSYSPLLGRILYLNPLIYISEGLRQALIGGPQFFSIALCISILLLLSVLFILISWYIFKKRVDHI